MTCLEHPVYAENYAEFLHDAQGNLVYNDDFYCLLLAPAIFFPVLVG